MRAFGRRFAPDERDHLYRAVNVTPPLPSPPGLRHRYWYRDGWWGDQGSTPRCVAFAWAHWLEDGPVTQPGLAPCLSPSFIYSEAQKVDEWPGESYDGTSVRAGAKVLTANDLIASYHWAFTVEEVAQTILSLGPMVVGTNWYESMSSPDEEGFLPPISGPVEGGHAYKLDGVNLDRAFFRGKNSWGRAWGKRGAFFISFEDFARLLREDGEACVAVEVRKG